MLVEYPRVWFREWNSRAQFDFIRERRKLGVAVARLIFWARHDGFDQAVANSRHAMTEAVSELLTRRIVPRDNFAPKHEALLDRLDDAISNSAITFDDLLALFFRGDKADLVAPLLTGDELEPAADLDHED